MKTKPLALKMTQRSKATTPPILVLNPISGLKSAPQYSCPPGTLKYDYLETGS